jgi:hypothetical protein
MEKLQEFVMIFKSLISPDPVKRLKKIAPELKELRENLKDVRWLMEKKNPLDAIVLLFNIMSEWHDKEVDYQQIEEIIKSFERVNYGQYYNELIKKLKTLKDHIITCGRDMDGWNRTKKGELVNKANVFLGYVYDLPLENISFWLTQKDQPKGGWGDPAIENLNSYDLICRYAEDFMDYNMTHIELSIDFILDFLKKKA